MNEPHPHDRPLLRRGGWRTFKLQWLWDLRLCAETFHPREMPPEKQDLNAHLPDDKKLVALFDPSERYKLIEAYGLDCYTELPDGMLRLEIGYTNRDFIISWLLGFGGNVNVLEPTDIAGEIKRIAKNILDNYK